MARNDHPLIKTNDDETIWWRFFAIMLAFVLGGCASSQVAPPPYYIIPGTAVGDPCKPDGMWLDTPRGYPRLCVYGKWLPLCDDNDSGPDIRALCQAYGRSHVPRDWR